MSAGTVGANCRVGEETSDWLFGGWLSDIQRHSLVVGIGGWGANGGLGGRLKFPKTTCNKGHSEL